MTKTICGEDKTKRSAGEGDAANYDFMTLPSLSKSKTRREGEGEEVEVRYKEEKD